MSLPLPEAFREVANEIEAGTLVPGTGSFYWEDDSAFPLCSLGHVAYRAGVNASDEFCIPFLQKTLVPITVANDAEDWSETVRLLREYAAKLEE